MIVPERKQRWLGLVFTYRGSALQRIRYRLLFVVAVATAVTLLHAHKPLTSTFGLTPFSLIGLALSIFLGFRNNTSYDRFWEGRKLWGSLVNVTRSFARKAHLLIGPLPEAQGTGSAQQHVVQLVIAYVHALRMHLRSRIDWAELEQYLSAEQLQGLTGQKNVPLAVLKQVSDALSIYAGAGAIHPLHVSTLDASLDELANIQGGCERIKSTPIPHSYTVLIHRIVALYVFALPLGLVVQLQYWTPLVVGIIAYAFLGLDAVGDEIEDPFGEDLNDLPLATLSRMIEVNLRQLLGQSDPPELLQPKDGVLL